ncbi:MAG: NAD(P)-dependent oxidoreductase [Chloracidobacterium sp.]|nr:NAD(P)-dependent oxidoreductase [Chloracidobacterium sp.]MDW8218292.1 NAD(P)-dependent oxidoreductase [Acidobacteriota bacterium]
MAKRLFLVIGGTGYVGARLAEHLARHGTVIVTGRRRSPERDRWLATNRNRLQWVAYDAAVDKLPDESRYEAVFNLATPSAAEAAAQPEVAERQALATVEAALALLAAEKARRLIHFSTFHVYGDPAANAPRPRYGEDDTPTPTHPYGVVHAACERRLAAAGLSEIVIIRPTNLIGPPTHLDLGPQWRLVFLDLCRQVVERRALTLLTDGLAYRDFLPMASALDALERLLAAAQPPLRCHLAMGCAMSLLDLARRIQRVARQQFGWEVTLTVGDRADAFRRPFEVETTRLWALGWRPPTDAAFDAEIAATLARFTQSL